MSKRAKSHWIHGPPPADEAAAQQELFNRYFERLVALARKKFRGKRTGDASSQDVALSAMNSYFDGVQQGHFPQLNDATDLWPLLVVIAARKAANQLEKERRQKRGGGKVRGESAFAVGNADEDDRRGIEQVIGNEPAPEFAVQVAEEYERRLEALDDESLYSTVQLKMEGYTNAEIAEKLDVAKRTVERKLALVRKRWTLYQEELS